MPPISLPPPQKSPRFRQKGRSLKSRIVEKSTGVSDISSASSGEDDSSQGGQVERVITIRSCPLCHGLDDLRPSFTLPANAPTPQVHTSSTVSSFFLDNFYEPPIPLRLQLSHSNFDFIPRFGYSDCNGNDVYTHHYASQSTGVCPTLSSYILHSRRERELRG